MRTKEQIVEQLNKLPKPYGGTNQASQLLTKVMIEVLTDIRDQLSTISIILGSVNKVAYRQD